MLFKRIIGFEIPIDLLRSEYVEKFSKIVHEAGDLTRTMISLRHLAARAHQNTPASILVSRHVELLRQSVADALSGTRKSRGRAQRTLGVAETYRTYIRIGLVDKCIEQIHGFPYALCIREERRYDHPRAATHPYVPGQSS